MCSSEPGRRVCDRPRGQCRKWRRPVRTITAPAASTAAITSSSRTLPPGWMNALTPASSSSSTPSANGKNASEAHDGAHDGSDGLLDGEARRVDTRLLTGADADGRQARARARSHSSGRAWPRARRTAGRPTAPRSAPSPSTTSMTDRSSLSLSRSWTRRPPITRRYSRSPGVTRRRSCVSRRRVFFAPSVSSTCGREAGRVQHLDEPLGERAGERRGHGAVHGDDPAVRRGRIGGVGVLVRLLDRRAEADAARGCRA